LRTTHAATGDVPEGHVPQAGAKRSTLAVLCVVG